MASKIVGFTSEAAKKANVDSGRISSTKANKLPVSNSSSSSSSSNKNTGSSSSSSVSTSNLKVGSTGDEVKTLQRQLGVDADGIYGPKTKAAVEAYQKSNGLKVDGIAGVNTKTALSSSQTKKTTQGQLDPNGSGGIVNYDPNTGRKLNPGETVSSVVTPSPSLPEAPTLDKPVASAPTATKAAPEVDPNATTTTDPNTGGESAGLSDPTGDSGFTRSLSQGSSGGDVANLQARLGISSDGNFGPQTSQAVKDFQLSHGLTPDGVVGPKTFAAMSAAGTSTDMQNINAGLNTPGAVDENGVKQPLPLPSTGDPTIDSLISYLNNQSPQKSFSDAYKEVYTSLGLDTMKSDYEKQTKEFTKLQDKKNDEVQDINNDPWLSEGVRVGKLRELDRKYEGKETILTNKLKLLETTISNSRADAQFITGHVMDQLNQSSKLTQDIIFKAIDIAESQSAAEAKAAIAEAKASAPSDYKPPTSYQEWELAGKPGTYADYLRESNTKAPTAAQQTVAEYAVRIEQAKPIIDRLEGDIQKMNLASFKTQINAPAAFQSSTIQQYLQAERNLINAKLRRESGAVISPTEFTEARQQYIPQPGDGVEVLKQKKETRDLIYASMKKAAGSAYSSVDDLLGSNSAASSGTLSSGITYTVSN